MCFFLSFTLVKLSHWKVILYLFGEPGSTSFQTHRSRGPVPPTLWPSAVYSNIVLPNLSFTNNTGNYRVTAFMPAPYLVTRICSLTPIFMKVTVHQRASTLPVGIEIKPILWYHLKVKWHSKAVIRSIDHFSFQQNSRKLQSKGKDTQRMPWMLGCMLRNV